MKWEIVQHDGTITDVPSDAVKTVQRRLENGQPIHTKDATIPANQVKNFRKTERQEGTKLIDAASQAFNEPVLNGEAIVYRWVKKTVPRDRWDKHYSKIPAYKLLDDDSSNLWVAYKQPIHQIDAVKNAYCNEDDIRKLENM